jgi:tryptophanyl-tRNA synthetase
MMPISFPEERPNATYTRDVASRFNHQMGENFVIQKERNTRRNHVCSWNRWRKNMSKSRGNIINIFLDDKALRKQVMTMKAIVHAMKTLNQIRARSLPSISYCEMKSRLNQ